METAYHKKQDGRYFDLHSVLRFLYYQQHQFSFQFMDNGNLSLYKITTNMEKRREKPLIKYLLIFQALYGNNRRVIFYQLLQIYNIKNK
ncbi:hypothetical protein AU378_13265 [Chryseobacterium kwangjuense]|uniref:Uncharacterized protein n=1 Tax=Chryseobacterium kwangjuense TaxID=267125 RepID=A0A135WEN0_9FLAO|nr:hypothetical protein AU378_13265 [Chryseobacterium kwangjuense]